MVDAAKIRRRRVTIDPLYDPSAKLWFAEEFNKCAPTLRELLEKLPKGTQIRNYYQGDSPIQRFENNDVVTRTYHGTASKYILA